MPKISVVMPVYNGEKYLKPALESILNQSFRDFEFIIVNDGSTDSSEEIIKSYDDARIVYLKNEDNLGLAKSFNIGIARASGQYIARMDADDIALPDRFEKQLKELESHAEIDILGSTAILIDGNGMDVGLARKPLNHIEIKWQSMFSTPLIHPTIMGKRNIFAENPYDENLHNSEDYELWSRLLFQKRARFANLREPLLKYRVYPQSFTQSLSKERRVASVKNTLNNIEHYTPLSDSEKKLIREKPRTLKEAITTFKVYRRAAKEFRKRENFNPSLSRYFLTLIQK